MSQITLLEILNKSTDFLKKKGVTEARYDAECLLAFGLKKKRMELYLNFDQPLIPKEVEALRELVLKRGQRIPLQHIIGTTGFRYLDLKCDSRALIPRPDTEGLVDLALEFLKEKKSPTILEIGVGTGAITLSLTKEFSEGQYVGADISTEALSLSKENAVLNELDSKVNWVDSDLFQNIQGQFDLIISNPPYIPEYQWNDLEPEVKNHDPKLALVSSGETGLDFIEMLLINAEPHLKPNGKIMIEHGFDQATPIKSLQLSAGLNLERQVKDYGGNDRFSIWNKTL